MKHSFYGGVHPHDKKEATCNKEVAPLDAAPAQVVIPMSMHVGAPCAPAVSVGDPVTVGQLIAYTTGLGAPIHASVSGKVIAVEPRPYAGGNPMLSVVIENDFQNTFSAALTPHSDYEKLSVDDLVGIIRDAGVTGMGGAGFPTHVKISSGLGKVDTLILNGAECEPYITADHRLMLEQGERIIGGVQILMQALDLKSAVIGVEANKEDAIEHMRSLLSGQSRGQNSGQNSGIEIMSLRTRYPQGAEKQLIQRVTGREIPPGGLPAHVGCAVFNIGTAAAVYDAVVLGKPLTERIVTVTGGALSRPRNLLVPLGTSFEHLIQEAGGFQGTPDRVLSGGPMMGIAQFDLSCGTIKGTNAILCMTKSEAAQGDPNAACIRCARCVNVCPMHLTPVNMHMFGEKRRWEDVDKLNVMDCIECGSCNYICPARIPLVQSFRLAKFEIRGLQAKQKAAQAAKKEAKV